MTSAAPGALDAGDGEDLPGDAAQVAGVGGDGADEQAGLAADPVGLQDFGDAGERGGDLVEPALGDLGGDAGGERVPEDLCFAKTRSQALTRRFAFLGRSPVFADQTAENLSALDPGGHVDGVAGLALQDSYCRLWCGRWPL
jgi:hypothetical protein